jgi:hypothetical protein
MLEEWILPGPVTPGLAARVTEILKEVVAARFAREVTWHEDRTEAGEVLGWLNATVRAGEDDIHDLARELDRPLDYFDGWDWEDEIDPLDDDEAKKYALVIELMNKVPETFDSGRGEPELPILSVYAKEGDNLAGWPAAFVLAARLAHELGAVEPESLPDQRGLN